VTTILTTPRLRLRLFTDSDVDAQHLVDLNANPAVTRYVGEGPVDLETARGVLHDRILAQHARHGVGRWAVERLDDGAFLGWCGFRSDADVDRYDLGYRFLEPAWGQGIATEAALACMAWADRELAGREIVGRARIENTASLRILERCGGVDIGTEEDCDGVVRVLRLRPSHTPG
jgi:RimJ/RimL family protein N-acetyltransferase